MRRPENDQFDLLECWVKHNRLVPVTLFFLPSLCIAGILLWLARGNPAAGLQRELAIVVVYIPCVFMFFCNFVQVGPGREYEWMIVTVLVWSASLHGTGSFHPEICLPITALHAAWICRRANRDPVRLFKRGIFRLRRGNPEGAIRDLTRSSLPTAGLFLAHALWLGGRADEAREAWRAALSRVSPGEVDRFRDLDPALDRTAANMACARAEVPGSGAPDRGTPAGSVRKL